jgi:SAM-dependent methyltransferase
MEILRFKNGAKKTDKMRTERIIHPSEAGNQLEKEWWNKHAATIEKIWAQNIYFQKKVRLPYLKKAKAFFLKDAPRPYTVHEIGCGSGWVGRLIADENLRIIGTDFSDSQIEIAKKNALVEGKTNYVRYIVSDENTFIESDGLLIHAFLHHLSKDELEAFFKIFEKYKPGTKIFIYEPVFYKPKEGAPSFGDKMVNKINAIIRWGSIRLAEMTGNKDEDLDDDIKRINYQAKSNDWYISPKEIPFFEGELESYLTRYCTIEKKYIVNKTDYDISQALTLNGFQKPNFLYSKILMPLTGLLDRVSFKGRFEHFLYKHQHLFTCFECVKK